MKNILLISSVLLPLFASKRNGSSARSFLRSERFHDRFRQMNNGVSFNDKVKELRDVFIRHLFSFDWMRKSQIYARSTFTIDDAVLDVNNLIGQPERLSLQYKFMPNPLRKDFDEYWDQIINHALYQHIMTTRIFMPAGWILKKVSTGEKLTLGVGFYSLNNKAWHLVKQRYETNSDFKHKFDSALDEILSHELYHVVDPKNYQKQEHLISSRALTNLDVGTGYYDALNQRATWTKDLVERFWDLWDFFAKEGNNLDADMIVDIVTDPREFWSSGYGAMIAGEKEYGPMMANVTQAIYTELEEMGVDMAEIRKRYGNIGTFAQRYSKLLDGTMKK